MILFSVASLADAIRCDMAFLLLNDQVEQIWGQTLSSWGWTQPATEWWADTISAVKSMYPNVIFLAEVYSPNEVSFYFLFNFNFATYFYFIMFFYFIIFLITTS